MKKPMPPAAVAVPVQFGHVVTELVRGETPDLSMRQMAVMLMVYNSDTLFSVKDLAKELNLSKPAVTRALDRLDELNFAHRHVNPNDRRMVQVKRADGGGRFMQTIASLAGGAKAAPLFPRGIAA